MQLVADYFPLILFFVAFKWQGIYWATGVAIAASVAQIAWFFISGRRPQPVHWLSFGIIVVFGGATLALHDDVFIRWKPTVLYALFALTLIVGRIGFGRNLIASVMKGVHLPERVWANLTWAWVGFFTFMGIANWYVAFHYPLETWVNFKVWGGMGLFLLFAVAQGAMLARHVMEEPTT
ncbi:MAG: septation protein A [Pseudomonadota bacterium]|nr:septation protein A [Pseudomonadota bacterium]